MIEADIFKKVLLKIVLYGKLTHLSQVHKMVTKVDVLNANHTKLLITPQKSIFMMKLYSTPIHLTFQVTDHQLLSSLNCHGKFQNDVLDAMNTRKEVLMNSVRLDVFLLSAQLDQVYIETAPNKVNATDAPTFKLLTEESVLL